MDRLYQNFIALIRKGIDGEALVYDLDHAFTAEQLTAFYRLAKSHDLAHLVGTALLSGNVTLPEALASTFQKEQMMALYRYTQIQYELDQICAVFEAEQIPHMPLKGAVIRQYYPKPEMRTSCDIDLFVPPEYLDAAVEALASKLHYRKDKKYIYDFALFSPTNVHVELHFNLVEDAKRYQKILSNVWKSARLDTGCQYRYLMSNEMYVAYHIIHMEKHFLNGGCGVRPFVDLWIIKNKMTFDADALMKLMEQCSLRRFAECVFRLCDVWFGDLPHDGTTVEMQNFIFSAGIYGSLKNKMSISQAEKGGKMKYYISRIFLPLGLLKIQYPFLEKYPFLYPVAQVKRWCRILFKNKSNVTREAELNNNITKAEREKLHSLRKDLGI